MQLKQNLKRLLHELGTVFKMLQAIEVGGERA